MKKLILLFILFMSVTLPAQAQQKKSTSVWCEAKIWPYDRNLMLPEIVKELNSMDRLELVQMIWGEILLRHQKPMAVPLIAFAAGSAVSSDLNGYFKALAYLNLRGEQVQEALQMWPKNRKAIEPVMTLEQMCGLFEKSHGTFWMKLGATEKSQARKPAKAGGKNVTKKKKK